MRPAIKKQLFIGILLIAVCTRALAQTVNPGDYSTFQTVAAKSGALVIDTTIFHGSKDLTQKEWTARWINVPGYSTTAYGVYLFRKTFTLNNIPAQLLAHVSADNRYKLYLNGHLVSLGPARGDLYNWYYETVDLSRYLITGKNCLAALVWNEGDLRAQAQLTYQTALIIQGEGALQDSINTNKNWKCALSQQHEMYVPPRPNFGYLTGPAEKIDFRKAVTGWELASFNDKSWLQARNLMPGAPKGILDWNDDWMLVERKIPLPELRVQRFDRVRLSSGVQLPTPLDNKSPFRLRIPKRTTASLIIDQGFLTNAFAVLKLSGGKDAGISISYAESLYTADPLHPDRFTGRKGNRNHVEGKLFTGKTDTLITSGDPVTFTSLSYRTFRYLRLTIYTAADPLDIDDFYGIFCGYPFKHLATFESSDTSLNKIFATGWRTARACAVETYMDCPYYEQLQYIGDTRIQAMVSLYNSGDDRLMRNAIEQLDYSRISEGITLSRYPAVHQIIPPFSLYWIGMLYDYYIYKNDQAFVRAMLDGSRQIFRFFRRYQGDDLLLTHVPYWNFTDWAEAANWDRGVAPMDTESHSALLDLQLLKAYELAAVLENDLGDKDRAKEYVQLISQMKSSIQNRYYDKVRHLYADNTAKTSFSQHTAALAILTGLCDPNESKIMAHAMLTDTSLTQATIYFKYYINQAVLVADPSTNYSDLLNDWRKNLAEGLTTWAEISNVEFSRSDCHAWGASPSIELLRFVLGVNSASPGFKAIRIEPHPGTLTWLRGTVPYLNGNINVECRKIRNEWKFKLRTPAGVPALFVWKNQKFNVAGGKEFKWP